MTRRPTPLPRARARLPLSLRQSLGLKLRARCRWALFACLYVWHLAVVATLLTLAVLWDWPLGVVKKHFGALVCIAVGLGLVWVLAVPSTLCKCPESTSEDLAEFHIDKLANDTYQQWRLEPKNSERRCPASIAELASYAGDDESRDPWGNLYEVRCVERPDHSRFQVLSRGTDGQWGTDDDLSSARR